MAKHYSRASRKQGSMTLVTTQFNKALRKFMKQTGTNAELGLRKTAIDLMVACVMRTPVETGQARAAWTPFLDKEGVAVDLGGNSAGIAAGRRQGKFEIVDTKTEYSITITNAVEYIVKLEYGWSKRRPEGMLRVSMREATKSLSNYWRKAA